MAEEVNNAFGCTCRKHFTNANDLLEHLAEEQQRAERLLAELKECLGHSLSRPPSYPPTGGTRIAESASPAKVSTEERVFLCPHPKCEGTRRVRFRRRRGLVRHYATHVDCQETCLICGSELHQVSHYLSHFDRCKKNSGSGSVAEQTIRLAKKKRKALMKIVNRQMGSEKDNSKYSESDDESAASSEHMSISHQDGSLENIPANFSGSQFTRQNEAQTLGDAALQSLRPGNSQHDQDELRSISAEYQEPVFDFNYYTGPDRTDDAAQYLPRASDSTVLGEYLRGPAAQSTNITGSQHPSLSANTQLRAAAIEGSPASDKVHIKSEADMGGSSMAYTMEGGQMRIPQDACQTCPDCEMTAETTYQDVPWQLEPANELESMGMLPYDGSEFPSYK